VADHCDDIVFEVEGTSEGDVLAFTAITPLGSIDFLADVAFEGSILVLSGLHIQGVDIVPGDIGVKMLRRIAQRVMELTDVWSIRIHPTRRSSGAHPGRYTKTIEFRRRS
jgi:hypothetical protein